MVNYLSIAMPITQYNIKIQYLNAATVRIMGKDDVYVRCAFIHACSSTLKTKGILRSSIAFTMQHNKKMFVFFVREQGVVVSYRR